MMETNRTNTDCWPLDEELGLFEARLMPVFLLASLTLEAEGSVVPGALPMRHELAASLLSLRREWDLLRERLAGR